MAGRMNAAHTLSNALSSFLNCIELILLQLTRRIRWSTKKHKRHVYVENNICFMSYNCQTLISTYTTENLNN